MSDDWVNKDKEDRAYVMSECDEIVKIARSIFAEAVLRKVDLTKQLDPKTAGAVHQIAINSLIAATSLHSFGNTHINIELKKRGLQTERFVFCDPESL